MFRFRLLIFVVVIILLAGCSRTGQVIDTQLDSESSASEPPATLEPVALTSASDRPENAAVGEAVSEEPVDYCLDCHADKQMLIDTASPEEEVINENKGEG